jgi:AcrR family transcriptional regulator
MSSTVPASDTLCAVSPAPSAASLAYEAIVRSAGEPSSADGPGRWPDVREAALSLFSARGYHGTTMKDVANVLGVRAPSLYNHVESKQEILQRIMVSGMQRLLAFQDAALASTDDVAEQLRRMTGAHVLVHIRHRHSAMVGDRELHNLEGDALDLVRSERARYESRYRALIQQGVDDGLFHVDQPKVATFAIIQMASSVSVWFNEDGPLTDHEVADEYGVLALRIVGADPSQVDTSA